MRFVSRLGLRTRLALALGGVAVAAVGLSTVLANQGLDSRLRDFARGRLDTAARHNAELAAGFHSRDGRWTRRAVADVIHVGQINGYLVEVRDARGAALEGSKRAAGRSPVNAQSPVVVRGRRVGTVVVAPLEGSLLSEQDRELGSDLDRLHMLAAVGAVALGLLAAVLMAASLARPIRHLTRAADRMQRGQLTARVDEGQGGEIGQLGRALNRLSATLEREEELRRETVADVAHELRTPVTGILARIEAAQDGVLADERANLDAMHTEALRLARLIEDIGRLAEAERPGLLVEKEPLDLGDVARTRADTYEALFAAKGIALERDEESAPTVGDRQRLDQVVDNLLSNALRYTDEGGRVELRTGLRDGEAVLEVEDTGIGIASADLDHIFTRFWRADRSRSRATGGAGIGLAVVRELVAAHDGRVEVDSAERRGSRFRVSLPAGGGPPQ